MLSTCYADAPRAMRLFPSSSLHRLLLRHAAACRDAGLHAELLEGEDDAVVRAWLAARGPFLPAELVEDLERIDDLTDDRGVAAIVDLASRVGIDAGALGRDAAEVAVRALLDHPEVFDAAHARRTVERLRGTTEYAAATAGAPRMPSDASIRAMEARLGRHFAARARSAHCRITFGRDRELLVFTIAHGCLERAEEALDNAPLMVCDSATPVYLAERTVRFRPQRRDVVVYDQARRRLRIRAADAPSLHAYRRVFGGLLHDDEGAFGTGAIVSLQPLLVIGRAVEEPTAGLREVRLVGLLLRHVAGPLGTIALDSEDIWPYLQTRVPGGFDDADLLEATFRLVPVGASRSTLVRVRLPNKVEYGIGASEVFRAFLEARGFFVASEARAG